MNKGQDSLAVSTANGRVDALANFGSVFFSDGPEQDVPGAKTEYVENTRTNSFADPVGEPKETALDTVETPGRRSAALKVLQSLIHADISSKDIAAIYNLLRVHLAKDGKRFM